MKNIQIKIVALILVCSVMLSCSNLKTAIFDQYSYQQAISLKVESDNLISYATNPYADYQDEIEDMFLDMQKMLEYEKNKPDNTITYSMWKLLTDKDKNLLAGFFKRWQEELQLSSAFTTEARAQITEVFDLIIKYEAQKNKTNESNIINFLTNN